MACKGCRCSVVGWVGGKRAASGLAGLAGWAGQPGTPCTVSVGWDAVSAWKVEDAADARLPPPAAARLPSCVRAAGAPAAPAAVGRRGGRQAGGQAHLGDQAAHLQNIKHLCRLRARNGGGEQGQQVSCNARTGRGSRAGTVAEVEQAHGGTGTPGTPPLRRPARRGPAEQQEAPAPHPGSAWSRATPGWSRASRTCAGEC